MGFLYSFNYTFSKTNSTLKINQIKMFGSYIIIVKKFVRFLPNSLLFFKKQYVLSFTLTLKYKRFKKFEQNYEEEIFEI